MNAESNAIGQPSERGSKRGGRKWAVLGGALLLAALGGALVWYASSPLGDPAWLQVKTLAAEGREQEALAALDESDTLPDQDVGELLATAQTAQAQGAPRLAVKLLGAANQPGPEQESVLRMLISLEYELEQFAAVLEHCQQLAKLVPEDAFAWLVSAGIYHENEQVAEALHAYRQALNRQLPANELRRVRYQIADLSMFMGDLPAAREAMDLLLAESQPSAEILLLHARLLRSEGESREALEVVNRILAEDDKLSSAVKLRGEIYLDEGQFARAAEDLENVVRADPYDYQAHYKLAQAYLRIGQPEQAQIHLTQSRRLTEIISETQVLLFQVQQDPSNRQIQLRLAELSEQQGDAETAQYWRESAASLP